MKTFLYILLFSVLIVACSEEDSITIAKADLTAYDLGTGTGVVGSARASYFDGMVTLSVTLKDQFPGTIRAIHLYEGNCESAENIWNIGNSSFCDEISNGSQWSKANLGDVGNVVVSSDGTAEFEITTDLWSIGTGAENDIVGKLLIIHAGPTNFFEECDPNHVPDHFHPNSKVACGLLSL